MSSLIEYSLFSIIVICMLFSCSETRTCGLDETAAANPCACCEKACEKDQASRENWMMLFDGSSLDDWRGYKMADFPEKGWVLEEGTLHVMAEGGGCDIVTKQEFGDFELELEFKVSPGANSGVIYLVGEEEEAPWQTGPEYQILDDEKENLSPSDLHSVGAMYALEAPPSDKPVRPAGEWNQVRIKVKDGKVEHWLNGMRIVACDINSEDWATKREASKFAVYPLFGKKKQGRISLQDHGDAVWFRNIRIREI